MFLRTFLALIPAVFAWTDEPSVDSARVLETPLACEIRHFTQATGTVLNQVFFKTSQYLKQCRCPTPTFTDL